MKQRRLPQLILSVLFIALLGFVIFKNRQTAGAGSGAPYLGSGANLGANRPLDAAAQQAALARHGFYLQNVAGAAGVNFSHVPPKLDPKLDPIMERVADMGAGVAVCDFDRDGKQDFYVTNSGENTRNALYHNRGNWKFEDVAVKMNVADLNQTGTGASMGAVWGDYDNDGYEDLFVYKWGRAELFHNDGGKNFSRVTEKTGLPRWMNANTAIWLDYDRDGKLDLFLGGYFNEKLDLWHLSDTNIMPDSVEYAKNGTKKYLFKGKGDGTFTDVSDEVGLNTKTWTLAAGAADLRGTGYPDLVLANDYGFAELWANERGARLREMGKQTGVGGNPPKSGMNVSFGDVLNQGKFAIYVSNITEDGNLLQYNNLWVPREGTSGDGLKYDNLGTDMGVGSGGWSFGAQFGDLNNDGALDLYLTNGYLSLDRNKSYWYDYGTVAGGNTFVISDAKNWPPVNNKSLSGYQQKRVWINDGAGKFQEVAQSVGANDLYDGRAVALADLDNNGTLDVLVANQRSPLLVYKNTAKPDNRWVDFDLEGAPGRSNRSAIGAEVTLFWNGQKQLQQVDGGSGFCAQNQRRLHFGLGSNAQIEKAVVRWPSGKTQTVAAPQAGTTIKVKEPV